MSIKLILTCLLGLLPAPASASTKCDSKLLASFHLSGLEYSINDQMKICPNVYERCCSTTDEINILRFWNDYAETRLKVITQQLYTSLRVICKYTDTLLKFTDNDIVVNSINFRWMTYPHRNVESNSLSPPRTRQLLNQSFNAFLPGRGRVSKLNRKRIYLSDSVRLANQAKARVSLVMYLAALANSIVTHFEHYEETVSWFEAESHINHMSFLRKTKKDRALLFTNFKKAVAQDVIRQKRELESKFEEVKQELAKSPDTSDLVAGLQSNYHDRFLKLLDEMKLFMNDLKLENQSREYIQRLGKAKNDIEKEMFAVEKIVNNARGESRKLAMAPVPENSAVGVKGKEQKLSPGKAVDRSLSDMDTKEAEKSDHDEPVETSNSQALSQEDPTPPIERSLRDSDSKKVRKMVRTTRSSSSRQPVDQTNRRLQAQWNRKMSASEEALIPQETKKPTPPRDLSADDMVAFNARVSVWEHVIVPRFQSIVRRLLNVDLTLPTIRKRYPRRPPRVQLPISVSHQVLRTRTFRRAFMRGLVVTNIPKLKFCYKISREFKAYPHQKFLEDVEQFFPINKDIMGLKKTLYCAICDASGFRNFVHRAGLIVFQDEFCMDMIERYGDYLRWKHIKMVQYFDLTYQYLSCLESDGGVSHFPFRSFLDRYKRRIDFHQRCLALGQNRSESFMAACHFLCTDFKLLGISRLWDADLGMVKNMLFVLFNSIRKHNWAPDSRIEAFRLIMETDLAFDDRWTAGHRDIEWNPKEDELLPDPLVGLEGLDGPKRRLRSMPAAIRDKQLNEMGDKIESMQKEFEILEKRAERGLNDAAESTSLDQKKQKAESLLSEATKLSQQMSNLPEQTAFDSISGLRPDLISKPDIQGPPKKLVKVNSQKTKSRSTKSTEPSKGVKPTKSAKASSAKLSKSSKKATDDEASLVAKLNSKGAARKLVGRKLAEASKKKSFVHQTIVAEPMFAMNEFFEKRNTTYDIAHYRSFYTSAGNALHPLKISSNLDFRFANITALLQEKYQSFNQEKISRRSINTYFRVNQKKINRFNNRLMEPIVIMFGKIKGASYELAHQQTPLPREYQTVKDNMDGPDWEEEIDKPVEEEDLDIEAQTMILPPGSNDPYSPANVANSYDMQEKLGHAMMPK
jgi:hypothetical protein